MPVVAAFKFNDEIAFGKCARKTNGRHCGFGSRVDEAYHFDRRNCVRDFLAEFHFERRSHAEASPARSLVGNGGNDIRMRVSQNQSAPGANEVDVFAAIYVK